jgi:hypothetical protein
MEDFMADFCKQCSLDIFGEDFRELAGLDKDPNDDLYPVVLCEGCGPIQVNNDGECISKDCFKVGKPGHGVELKKGDDDASEG